MNYQAGILDYQEKQTSMKVGDSSQGGPLDKKDWKQVIFEKEFKSTPVVTVSVLSFKGPQTPGVRITDVTPQGFKFRLNEVVVLDSGSSKALSDGRHDEEKIGWIAVEPNQREK